MSMKINKLEIENVKRIKAVKVEPKANGLTVIGGNNNQGKTSVLNSIAWALGGERYKPSQATREGSVIKEFRSWKGLLTKYGIDISEPVKKNSRYIYFEKEGDWINGKM